jgi:hypothetical protein
MNKEKPEKRRGPRILTAMPVFLKNTQGITRDVSASGVYFWLSEPVCAPGESISLSVELKRARGRMLLKCQGDVLRTEPCPAGIGVAVSITDSAMTQA